MKQACVTQEINQRMPLASFLDYLRSERNRSEHTVRNYEVALRSFQSFFLSLGEGLSWETVDSDVVREWVIHMMDEEDKKATTVNLSLSALRSFYHYLQLTGKVAKSPLSNVTGPKKPKQLPAFVREDDMERLLDECEYAPGFSGVRDHLILELLYSTGMRRAEILDLTDSDLRLSEGLVKVTGKRNKQRLIPISPTLSSHIADYLKAREENFPDGYVGTRFLIGDHGKDLRPDEIQKIVKENLSRVTNQERRSPHVLRHTFATAMLNNGADLQSIQRLMGHESLTTTQVYTHLSFEELKNTYKKSHPRSHTPVS